jgi:hypothetical protein
LLLISVHDFGIGFFKFDNNTMTWPGTDKDSTSLGHGLLEHQRALLARLDDDLQTRLPNLLIENCAPGAMRMELHQEIRCSTHPIVAAAAAPRERYSPSLVNGIPGHLNRMMPTELDLIRSALAAHRAILADLDALVPARPLGLPTWSDEWIPMFLNGPTSSYLTLWHRAPRTANTPEPSARVLRVTRS